MVGYSFFSGNEKLAQASSLSILLILTEPITLNLGDEFCYQFCDQISQLCGTFHIMPQTRTIVLDYNGFYNFVSGADIIISNLFSNLGITKVLGMEKAQKFFYKRNVIVQAAGVHEAVCKVGSYLQSADSVGLVK